MDPAKHTVVAFLPDEDGEPGASVTLSIKDCASERTEVLRGGRAQKNKIKGAVEALEKTERSKKTADKKAARKLLRGSSEVGREQGVLVREVSLGNTIWWAPAYRGKDAKGNDVLVRSISPRVTCTSMQISTVLPHAH